MSLTEENIAISFYYFFSFITGTKVYPSSSRWRMQISKGKNTTSLMHPMHDLIIGKWPIFPQQATPRGSQASTFHQGRRQEALGDWVWYTTLRRARCLHHWGFPGQEQGRATRDVLWRHGVLTEPFCARDSQIQSKRKSREKLKGWKST